MFNSSVRFFGVEDSEQTTYYPLSEIAIIDPTTRTVYFTNRDKQVLDVDTKVVEAAARSLQERQKDVLLLGTVAMRTSYLLRGQLNENTWKITFKPPFKGSEDSSFLTTQIPNDPETREKLTGKKSILEKAGFLVFERFFLLADNVRRVVRKNDGSGTIRMAKPTDTWDIPANYGLEKLCRYLVDGKV